MSIRINRIANYLQSSGFQPTGSDKPIETTPPESAPVDDEPVIDNKDSTITGAPDSNSSHLWLKHDRDSYNALFPLWSAFKNK